MTTVVDGTLGVTLPNSLNAIDSSATHGRNIVLNGDHTVDQENAGAAVSLPVSTDTYIVDGWIGNCVGATCTGQQVTGDVSTKALRLTGTAGVTSLSTETRIESLDAARLVNKTATFSVNVKNTLLTTATWTAYYADTADNFTTKTEIATGVISLSATSTRQSFSFNAGANAANGISVVLSVGAQTSGTFTIELAQLEDGSVATNFEHLPYRMRLIRCQRYLFKCLATTAYASLGVMGFSLSSTQAQFYGNAPTSLRGAPTFSHSTNLPRYNNGAAGYAATAFTGSIIQGTTYALGITTSGMTGQVPGTLDSDAAGNVWYMFDSRL